MSTFALTMYRYIHKLDNVEYKVGNNFCNHCVSFLNNLYSDIWDTAGQECFQTLHPSYYFAANICILVKTTFFKN